jgi:23S rRNA (pseudouridine1915-N3)-methyltransferase
VAILRLGINAINKISNSAPEGKIIDSYAQRLPFKFDINQIDSKDKFPADKQKIYEGELLLKSVQKSDFVIALEEKGKQFTSVEFASYITKTSRPIVFIIGGAYGLSDEVRNRADLILSLGKITMPHALARVVLVEQIYRAYTIDKNHPYHK